MKIFEIPIYAFNRITFQKRVDEWRIRHHFNNREFDYVKKNQKQYEYNHIVGFIQIWLDRDEILGDVYLPCTKSELGVTIDGHLLDDTKLKRRYVWYTTNKVFLIKQGVNGTHFRIAELHSNSEVVANLDSLMTQLIESVKEYNKLYYIDLEAFNAVKDNVDYLRIYNSM